MLLEVEDISDWNSHSGEESHKATGLQSLPGSLKFLQPLIERVEVWGILETLRDGRRLEAILHHCRNVHLRQQWLRPLKTPQNTKQTQVAQVVPESVTQPKCGESLLSPKQESSHRWQALSRRQMGGVEVAHAGEWQVTSNMRRTEKL